MASTKIDFPMESGFGCILRKEKTALTFICYESMK